MSTTSTQCWLFTCFFFFLSFFACDPVAVRCISKVSRPSSSSQMNKWKVPGANLSVCVACCLLSPQYAKSSPVTVHACISNISLWYFFLLPLLLPSYHSLSLCPWCRVVPSAVPRANSRGTNGNEMLISAVSLQHMRSTLVFCACVCMQRHVNGC